MINTTIVKSISINITGTCQSKCKTCNIWKNPKKDLSTEKWIEILKKIGKGSIFFTITGGEPFLRNDLPEIFCAIAEYNKPKFINIATNGLATEKIIATTKTISDICNKNKIKLALNFSIDGIHKKYDEIRGTDNGFNKVVKTINELKKIKEKYGFDIGTNITVSEYNIDEFFEIYSFIEDKLKPNTIISEIATNRKLFYLTEEIKQLDSGKYDSILKFLINKSLKNMFSINPRTILVNYFRLNYYSLIRNYLRFGKKIACLAGKRSIEITNGGEIISCCMKMYSLGNILKTKGNLDELLHSKKSSYVIDRIKREKCFCTLSNPNFTNLLFRYNKN